MTARFLLTERVRSSDMASSKWKGWEVHLPAAWKQQVATELDLARETLFDQFGEVVLEKKKTAWATLVLEYARENMPEVPDDCFDEANDVLDAAEPVVRKQATRPEDILDAELWWEGAAARGILIHWD